MVNSLLPAEGDFSERKAGMDYYWDLANDEFLDDIEPPPDWFKKCVDISTDNGVE